MTTLILDSNPLFAAVYRTPGFAIPLDGPFEEAMLLARLGEVRIVVSELCSRETERRLRRECDPTRNGRRRSARARAELGLSADSSSAELAVCLADWRQRFESVLKEHGVELAPVPEVAQNEVVDRLLQEGPPFTGKGDDGYRDFLIWETALREAAESDFAILVSDDRRAFAQVGNSSVLHPALQREACKRLGHSKGLMLARTLNAALDLIDAQCPDCSVAPPGELVADLVVEISHEAVELDGEPGLEARRLLGEEIRRWRLQRLVALRDVSLLPSRHRRIRAALTFDALLHARITDEPGGGPPDVEVEDIGMGLASWDLFVDFKHPVEVRAEAFVGPNGEMLLPRLISWRLLGANSQDPRQLQLN